MLKGRPSTQMTMRIGKLGVDPAAPFGLRLGDKVAWRRDDGTPDPEIQGTIIDGSCKYTVGGGSYHSPVYAVARDDGMAFLATEIQLVPLVPLAKKT